MRYGVATGIRIYLDSGDTVKFILIAIAAVLLEVYLAYREKRWPGLLLPIASVHLFGRQFFRCTLWDAAGGFAPSVFLREYQDIGAAHSLCCLPGDPAAEIETKTGNRQNEYS